MLRLYAIAMIAVGLTGCFRFDSDGPATEATKFLVDLVVNRPQPPAQPLDPIYCYRTLAVVDCAAEPVFGDERRLVGHYGPRSR